MKIIIISILWGLPFLSHAQYESIFGQNSTQWIFEWSNFFGSFQDTIYVEKDTVFSSFQWKKIVCGNCTNAYSGGFLREDTTSGKIWYKAIYDSSVPDTSIQIICDLSLQKGDSFNLTGSWGGGTPPPTHRVVDSVYYENGKKCINFDFGGYSNNLFREGVGAIISPIYKHQPTVIQSQTPLCFYKDGDLSYNDPNYTCVPILNVKNTKKEQNLNIHPNPNKGNFFIEYKGQNNENIVQLRIFDLNGCLLVEENNIPLLPFHKQQISTQILQSGLYFVHLIHKDGTKEILKFVKN